MINLKKIHFRFKDEQVFLFLGALIVAVGVFGVSDYFFKQTVKEDVVDTFDENIPLLCEKGNWIEFPDVKDASQYGKFSGSGKLEYDEGKDVFTDADGGQTFSTDQDYSLFFFVDRDVQMEGYRLDSDKVYVKRIKCVGAEADKDILRGRRNLMDYIANNINSIAPEKAPGNDWQVETFYFVSGTDLYVQYETPGSFVEESPYDSHLWLIRASDLDSGVPKIETLAYIQEDAEDAAKDIVKQGTDLYKDNKNMTIYEFDSDANQWILQ
jgi:hypothetical protein